MDRLNFPVYEFRIRQDGTRQSIFDPFRKKYVALSPEEWVRQHLARYLVEEKQVPAGLVSLEAWVKVVNENKRYDLVVFSNKAVPLLVAEVKAPGVKIDRPVIDQAMRYNHSLKAPFILISNGLRHFCFQFDYATRQFELSPSIPSYPELLHCGESL